MRWWRRWVRRRRRRRGCHVKCTAGEDTENELKKEDKKKRLQEVKYFVGIMKRRRRRG